MRILFFGDSITQGYWSKEGGWVGIIRKHFDNRAIENLRDNREPEVYNLGVSGDTTRNILARIENELKVRIWENDPIVVVIAVGTNDALVENEKQWIGRDEFKENLQKIVRTIKPLVSQVVFVGGSPCDEKLTRPVFWGDLHYINDNLLRAERDIAAVAKINDIPFIPVFEKFKAKLDAGESLLADGLHPNNHGHAYIAEIVLPEIQRILSKT